MGHEQWNFMSIGSVTFGSDQKMHIHLIITQELVRHLLVDGNF